MERRILGRQGQEVYRSDRSGVLGMYAQFLQDIKKVFEPFDAPGDALEELKNLRMGNNSAEDHVAQFKILVTKANIPESNMLIDAF